ncbi:response regulator transcription factor [Hamadaea tsunoensis]|uniref:response regulator transcription factor n=1 Tax=Hamadaea tsunoensis TaxID=53368 RepID=UPI000423A634|nr:response regulator transcription factor [Hamadaea tsunoensis]
MNPPRVVLVGAADGAFAAMLGGHTTLLGCLPLAAAVMQGRMPADLILLRTDEVRDVSALARAMPEPAPPILVLTRTMEPADVVPALRAGATSLLVEGQFTRADLLDAVHGTIHGQSRLSPACLTAVVRHLRHPSAPSHRRALHTLTRREREIMELVVAGESNGSIAAKLCVAEKTVRNAVSRIYKKLRVRNRAEAIVAWLAG